jgi:hypothetical protein
VKELEAAVAATLEEIADQAHGPSLQAAALWKAGRRRRTRTMVMGATGMVSAAALLVGISAVLAPSGGGEPATPAPTALATPIEFRQVSAIDARPCLPGAGLPGSGQGECYHVSGAGMRITRVKSLRVISTGADPHSLVVQLVPADAARFASLTGEVAALHGPASQLAIIVNGVVISSPVVAEPITGDVLQINIASAADADQLYRSLLPGITTPTATGSAPAASPFTGELR